jgi:hypothetical protein
MLGVSVVSHLRRLMLSCAVLQEKISQTVEKTVKSLAVSLVPLIAVASPSRARARGTVRRPARGDRVPSTQKRPGPGVWPLARKPA